MTTSNLPRPSGYIVYLLMPLVFLNLFLVPETLAQTPPSATEPSQQVEAEQWLRLHGSNTIGAHLAVMLSRGFLLKEGAEQVVIESLSVTNETRVSGYFKNQDKTAYIDIKAHGSGSGFTALEEDAADIGMSSRAIKADENYRLMKRWGDMTRVYNEHVIGLDGLAIIKHPDNPVQSINMQQLADVFAGRITNWQQLGGENLAIQRFARDDKSGTYDTFAGLVLKPYGYKLDTAKRFESNEVLVDSVQSTPSGIGFTAYAFAPDNMLIAISANESLPPVKPTTFSIASEDYPLSRRLYLYGHVGDEARPRVPEFMAFVQSETGQDIVKQSHFIKQSIITQKPPIPTQAPPAYQRLIQRGQRLSMTFRLHPERSEMDNKSAKDLNRLIEYLNNSLYSELVLVGLTGAIEYGVAGDDKRRGFIRSKLLEHHLKRAGIKNISILSLGNVLPIDNNEHPAGRIKNTRTEVWIVPVSP